jgi:hypothetical protein
MINIARVGESQSFDLETGGSKYCRKRREG